MTSFLVLHAEVCAVARQQTLVSKIGASEKKLSLSFFSSKGLLLKCCLQCKGPEKGAPTCTVRVLKYTTLSIFVIVS